MCSAGPAARPASETAPLQSSDLIPIPQPLVEPTQFVSEETCGVTVCADTNLSPTPDRPLSLCQKKPVMSPYVPTQISAREFVSAKTCDVDVSADTNLMAQVGRA
jgi:hypothetical protein